MKKIKHIYLALTDKEEQTINICSKTILNMKKSALLEISVEKAMESNMVFGEDDKYGKRREIHKHFRIDPAIDEKIDKYCNDNHMIKSEFIRSSIAWYIKSN